ncbi:hypothetical protein [Halorussus salinus]|uniref:hypothetical protein n=1 Tax=Halorussus salinus TaxID=1364935 RepID=UPI00192F8C23|nr:hypothetical protein [Halorussus salinus]
MARPLLAVGPRHVPGGATATTGSTAAANASDGTDSTGATGADSTATAAPNIDARVLRLGYAATALSLALLVALAEVLAHG